MSAITVVGLQWGDEGKGKVIDLLSHQARYVARAQGGNNAGHTVIAHNQEFKLHLVPSGILYPHVTCLIGAGVVLDPASFFSELDTLSSQGIVSEGRLFVSGFAHVIFPYHRRIDQLAEERKGNRAVGTTGRGIGPCYADKINRLGLRIADLFTPSFHEQLAATLEVKNWEMERLYGATPMRLEEVLEEIEPYLKRLEPLVSPVEEQLFEILQRKEKILFEGAQGALLDNTFGTYPFVTSSCTLSGGISTGLGISPNQVGKVLGVVKAYSTRVGNGPFPTELNEEERALFPDSHTLREVGVTTGRARRVGWMDAFALRHACRIGGVDSLALTKLDVLDELDEIKICIGYRGISHYPPSLSSLTSITPIYETHPGWKSSTKGVRLYDDLPSQAKSYLRRVEELLEVPLGLVSVGPDRKETIWMDDLF